MLIDKEQNILKIIDFGTAEKYDKKRDKLKGLKGTAYYVAPEVIEGNYDERCDVWSIGVIMYILLSGSPPFDGDQDADILRAVKKGQYSFTAPVWKQISVDAKNLLKKLLTQDYKARPYARDLINDVWFERAPK